VNGEAFMSPEPERPLESAASLSWRGWPQHGENLLMVAAMLLMMTLPLGEIFLRALFRTGISGSSAIVQHLTLIVGMLGGAIAAREGRLLALAAGPALVRGWTKTAAGIFSGSVAAVVTSFLGLAGLRYALAMRPLGKTLVYGVSIWIIQLVLPLGFGLVAWRVIGHAARDWKGRLAAVGLAVLWMSLVGLAPWRPDQLMWPALALLGTAALLGAPIFATLGGAALVLFWSRGMPLQSVPLKHYSLTTNDTLPSVPIFTLAGYFLAESGASRRLVRLFQALVGQVRGGPSIVTALTCAFFTSFTGASGVTILALGGVLMPMLLAARYPERAALGLVTGAGSLGMLFPPCLPLILYAIVANHSAPAGVTIKQMFLGGIGPGILLTLLTVGWGVRQEPRTVASGTPFRWSEAGQALWAAKWEMLIPVVAVGALFFVPTTVEAASLPAS
jgi:C4-dicarboxylate transporter DctM subunit